MPALLEAGQLQLVRSFFSHAAEVTAADLGAGADAHQPGGVRVVHGVVPVGAEDHRVAGAERVVALDDCARPQLVQVVNEVVGKAVVVIDEQKHGPHLWNGRQHSRKMLRLHKWLTLWPASGPC